MNLVLTPDQKRLQEEARTFAKEHVEPTSDERSRLGIWDPALWRRIGENRWQGIAIPKEYDGLGAGAVEHAILVEEFCRVDASIGGALNLVQQTIAALLHFSPKHQKEKYLPMLARGEAFSVTGITEAAAGSKLSDMHTSATPHDGGWLLRGSKSEVHAPEHSRPCLILAKTPSGISAFLLDTQTAGFRVVRQRNAIGLRAMPMAEIAFDGCHLTPDCMFGNEGDGYKVFFKSFDFTRVGNAAKAIGIAEGALQKAVAYARERNVGENVVTDFQGIRWQIAEFNTRIEAARMLMYKAAHEYNVTGRCTMSSSQAKLLACNIAMEATVAAVQITGSHGCFDDQPFARYMMDAKVSQVTGGTMEILKNTIARELLGKETQPRGSEG